MIYIFVALYCEAESIISKYNLTRSSDSVFDVYSSDKIVLTVTGVGKIKAATAVSHILSIYGYKDCHILNIGTACGDDIGAVFIASSIEDCSSRRTLYPDMIIDFSLPEGKLITVDTPITSCDGNYYDMEAYGIAQSVLCYVGPDQFTIMKVVSDNGSTITADSIKSIMSSALNKISHVIDLIIDFNHMHEVACIEEDLDILANKLKCSEYMRGTLKQLLIYANCMNVDLNSMVDAYLPINDRRRGKEVLDELRKQLTS